MAPPFPAPPAILPALPLPKGSYTSPAILTSPLKVRPVTQAAMAFTDDVPELTAGPQLLHDYLRRVSELDNPPFTPMFLPADTVLVVHKRVLVAETWPDDPDMPGVDCYSCCLTTRKSGRTWVLEASVQELPCWVLFKRTPTDADVLEGPLVRTMMLAARDDHLGPEPGWADLKKVLLRETQSKEGAYYVDSLTGAVEGLDA